MARRQTRWQKALTTTVLATAACGGQPQTAAKSADTESDRDSASEPRSEQDGADPADTEAESARPAPLREPEPPGTVTFSYESLRITACALLHEGDEPVCRATAHVAHPGAAEVALLPVDEHGEEDPLRSEVVLSFAAEVEAETRAVDLGGGRWELEWKGESTARDRFRVVSQDRFEITLQGIAGMCSLEGKSCKLEPQKNQQVIELPEARSSD